MVEKAKNDAYSHHCAYNQVHGCISTGKEANVYYALGEQPRLNGEDGHISTSKLRMAEKMQQECINEGQQESKDEVEENTRNEHDNDDVREAITTMTTATSDEEVVNIDEHEDVTSATVATTEAVSAEEVVVKEDQGQANNDDQEEEDEELELAVKIYKTTLSTKLKTTEKVLAWAERELNNLNKIRRYVCCMWFGWVLV